jgi:hypothetical protein
MELFTSSEVRTQGKSGVETRLNYLKKSYILRAYPPGHPGNLREIDKVRYFIEKK